MENDARRIKAGDRVAFLGAEGPATWKVLSVSSDGNTLQLTGPGLCRSIREAERAELVMVSRNPIRPVGGQR